MGGRSRRHMAMRDRAAGRHMWEREHHVRIVKRSCIERDASWPINVHCVFQGNFFCRVTDVSEVRAGLADWELALIITIPVLGQQ